MSEQSAEANENPETQEPTGETPEPEQEPQEQDEFKSEESKKAVLADLAKEREAKRELQAKVEEYEQAKAEAEKAKLSDIERAQTEAQEATGRAEKAEKELLRVSIASTHGITDKDDIELFLTGADEDTLTRQAKRLAERQSASGPTNPKPDPSQGPKGEEAATDAEKAAAAEKAGDRQEASRLKAQQLGALSQQMSS